MKTPTIAMVRRMVDQGQFDDEDLLELLDDLAEELEDVDGPTRSGGDVPDPWDQH